MGSCKKTFLDCGEVDVVVVLVVVEIGFVVGDVAERVLVGFAECFGVVGFVNEREGRMEAIDGSFG